MNNTDPGFIGARAINSHPWLDATYPDHDDTDLAITPPYPAKYDDRPTGYIEGEVTWNHNSDSTVTYRVAIAYEGTYGVTVEDTIEAVIDPMSPLAWVDLARVVAGLVDQLDRELTATA